MQVECGLLLVFDMAYDKSSSCVCSVHACVHVRVFRKQAHSISSAFF